MTLPISVYRYLYICYHSKGKNLTKAGLVLRGQMPCHDHKTRCTMMPRGCRYFLLCSVFEMKSVNCIMRYRASVITHSVKTRGARCIMDVYNTILHTKRKWSKPIISQTLTSLSTHYTTSQTGHWAIVFGYISCTLMVHFVAIPVRPTIHNIQRNLNRTRHPGGHAGHDSTGTLSHGSCPW